MFSPRPVNPDRNVLKAIFGDGSDGDVTVSSGTTTLTRDMFYKNLTVSGTGTINTDGYRVYVSETLTISTSNYIGRRGTDGNAASGDTPGASVTGLSDNVLGGSGDGGVGGGAFGGGNGSNQTGEGGGGGDGGDGGAGTGQSSGGTGGTATVFKHRLLNHNIALNSSALVKGGAGGAGGGRGGLNGGTRGAGGSGAAGGGVVQIFARFINASSNDSINAEGGTGGAGGDAAGGGNSSGGGGGGGGGGGFVKLACERFIGTIADVIDIAGGAGGAAGSGEGTGSDGVAGSTGTAGNYCVFQLGSGTVTST